MILSTFFIFILGLVIGSFLNVLIDRLPFDRPILNSRSVCDSCHKQLKWFELVPLVSYLLQRGKCRHCSARIPLRIFLLELATGILFAVIYLIYSPFYHWYFIVLALVITAGLLVIFFADWQYGIIPDEMLIVVGIAALTLTVFQGMPVLGAHIVAGLGAFLGFYALYLITRRRGMGFGDVKFAFVMGLLLGYPGILLSLYIAFLTGGLISLILIIGGRKKFRKDTIAFGPFLVLGIVFYLVFQGMIYQYLHSIGL